MRCLLFLLLACGGDKESTTSTGTAPSEPTESGQPVDTAADTGSPEPIKYTIETVARTTILGLDGVRAARSHPTHGGTYVLDDAGLVIRSLTHTWVHPYGAYCLGGAYDEEGVCRGGIEQESGRLSSPQPTRNWCSDDTHDMLIMVKQNGLRLELVDVGKTGPNPYTLNQASGQVDLPSALSASASYTGPCAAIPGERAVVLSSAIQQALAVVSTDNGSLLRKRLLEFEPVALAREGNILLALDGTRDRLVQLNTSDLTELAHVSLDGPAVAMAVGAGTRQAWLTMASGGVQRIVMGVHDYGEVDQVSLDGTVHAVVADGERGLAWASVERDGDWSVVLLSGDGVMGAEPIDGPVLSLSIPNQRGDVAVFTESDDGDVDIQVLAPAPDRPEGPILHGFLFTTIEEPSDLNMGIPCTGGDIDFARELNLVRNNAAIVASLGVPVALAVTDNFAQKAEECGETAIFDELAAHGFTLGVLLHNRPCYNCTDGTHDSNPAYCARDSPLWARATSPTACFPDDPEYCPTGDWDCYRSFIAPRVDLVDRNIPGGGQFITGADRHRMWDQDWIRLYQEIERPSVGRTGFDLSMFASAWAYDEVAFSDVRGKDLAPWRLEDKTAAWSLGDIHNWTQDSPRSDVLYLPGMSWSTVKLAEQQQSGLYMIDFFTSGAPISYQSADYDAVFQDLRTAVAHRKSGELNTWYLHIHDLGTLNLRDVRNDPLMTDPDGEDGPEGPVPTETLIRAFIERVDERYVGSGVFEWTAPRAIRSMSTD